MDNQHKSIINAVQQNELYQSSFHVPRKLKEAL